MNVCQPEHQIVDTSVFAKITDSLPAYTLQSGTLICRCRVNKPFTKRFISKTELFDSKGSYSCLGRANREKQSVFYGCIHDVLDYSHVEPVPRIVNVEESSSFYRDTSASGIEVITFSGWIPSRDLRLLCIPSFGQLENPCRLSCVLDDMWSTAKREISDEVQDYVGMISHLFTCEDDGSGSIYRLTSEFSNYVLSSHNEIDGVLYPSVRSQGQGLNVAIKGDVVDESIDLRDIIICHLLKNTDKAYLINVFHAKGDKEPFEYTRHKSYDSNMAIQYRRELGVDYKDK